MRSFSGSGAPSTVILSFAVTVTAGLVSTSPFTATRPSAIHSSISRREARPARATTLATRSASFFGAAGSSRLRRGTLFLSLRGGVVRGMC